MSKQPKIRFIIYIQIFISMRNYNCKFIRLRDVFVWGPFMSKTPEDDTYGVFYKINETVNISESTKLKIGQTMESSFSLLEQKTTQFEFFQIEPESGMELDDETSKINHFLRLCMGKPVFPKYIKGTTTNSKNFKYYPY